MTLSGLSDAAVTTKGVELIQSGYDFIFLHIDDPDGTGHGDQTKEEKTIFIASNKTLNSEFNTVPSGLNNQDFSNLYAHPAQTSLVPTALRYLGISIDQNWLLDGTPLLGEAGVRKLLPAQGNDFDITWLAEEHGNIDIYRNQEFVTQVAATESGWSDDAELQGLTDYSLVKNNTPAAIRLNKSNITAAVSWDSTRAYFFRDDSRYIRYAKVLDKADGGYPKAINNNTWPGLGDHAKDIQAAVKWNNDRAYIFLTGQRYIRYDLDADRADAGYPAKVNNTSWEGVLTP